MSILEVHNLTKRFGKFTAVDDVSFNLEQGEILGLLGPNGAGKTTTLQMLLGVLTPTSGSINCFGKELSHNREEILDQMNFSSTYTNLPWRLTVRENLTFMSYLYTIKDRKARLQEIAKTFKLQPLWNKAMADLSAGQKTRVNLAKAFLNMPRILLLDEPTASLDPDVAEYIRKFLARQQQQYQVSIIITSHNMAEVEEICDRVVFINQGKLVANDTPANLARTIEICHVNLVLAEMTDFSKEYFENSGLAYQIEKNSVTIDVTESRIADFLQDLTRNGIKYEEISIEKPSLEDYFLSMIHREVKHEAA